MWKDHIDKIYTFISYLLVFVNIFAKCYVASTFDKGLASGKFGKKYFTKKAGVHNSKVWTKILRT